MNDSKDLEKFYNNIETMLKIKMMDKINMIRMLLLFESNISFS